MGHEKLDVYLVYLVSLEVVRSVGLILKQSTTADRVITRRSAHQAPTPA